jgi:hypothetical protein
MKRIIGISYLTAIAGITFGFFCQNQCANAGEDKQRDVSLEIEKLSLFKNGLGFIVSSATLPQNARTIRIGQLPVPSFGTFWVGYPRGVKLQSLVTSMENLQKNVPVQSIDQLLRANAGRKVMLHTSDRDIGGTILAEPVKNEPQDAPNPYFMSSRPYRNSYSRYYPETARGEFVKIKTDKGILALAPGSVLRVEFIDGDPIDVISAPERCPAIRVNLEKSSGGEKISVSYLARGVTWSPSYLIDLSDARTAKFSAHAIIVNEMTDFKNVQLQLVTGFPNIKFGDIINPVAKSQTLAEFLDALSGGRGRRSSDNYVVTQQALMSNTGSPYESYEPPPVPSYSTAAEGLAAEDLFFYPVEKFTLLKNETAWIPLFSAELPYKHIYTWKIGDFVDEGARYRPERQSQDQKPVEEVWHSCRLINTLSMPLTTAATEFVTNGEFAGQDVCYYTAPKAETTIRINKALNVQAEQAEMEVERKRDAATFHSSRYDLVKVRGELKIRNQLEKTINVEITKELSGEVLESTPKSEDTKTAKGLKQVNPKHVLMWSIQMKPGEEQKVNYLYQVYIHD